MENTLEMYFHKTNIFLKYFLYLFGKPTTELVIVFFFQLLTITSRI